MPATSTNVSRMFTTQVFHERFPTQPSLSRPLFPCACQTSITTNARQATGARQTSQFPHNTRQPPTLHVELPAQNNPDPPRQPPRVQRLPSDGEVREVNTQFGLPSWCLQNACIAVNGWRGDLSSRWTLLETYQFVNVVLVVGVL